MEILKITELTKEQKIKTNNTLTRKVISKENQKRLKNHPKS